MYVVNSGSNSVSVINTSTNTVVATIPVETAPAGVTYDSSNGMVYVSNSHSNTVSVISTTLSTQPPPNNNPILIGGFGGHGGESIATTGSTNGGHGGNGGTDGKYLMK